MNYEPLPVSNDKVPSLKTYSTGKRPRVEKPSTWFGGWHVYGITKARHEVADAAHKAALDKWQEKGGEKPVPMQLKPARLTPKPYFIEESMKQFVEPQAAAGTTDITIKKLVAKGKQ